MKIKGKQEDKDALELYVIDTVHEHKSYDIFHKYAIDKETFNRYFPDWEYKNSSKPKLKPKRKKA